MRMPLPLLSILVISLYIAACNSLQTIDPISMQSEADSFITDSISGEVNPDTLSEQATIDSASCHKKMNSGMMNSGMMNSGMMNSGMMDSGMMDSGMMDSGMMDSGMMDSGMMDSPV